MTSSSRMSMKTLMYKMRNAGVLGGYLVSSG